MKLGTNVLLSLNTRGMPMKPSSTLAVSLNFSNVLSIYCSLLVSKENLAILTNRKGKTPYYELFNVASVATSGVEPDFALKVSLQYPSPSSVPGKTAWHYNNRTIFTDCAENP